MKRLLQHLTILLFLIFTPFTLLAQVPLNWTRDEINPGEDFTLLPDESLFTEGLKSVHMQLISGAVPYLVSDVFYVTPGVNYEFSVDVFDNDTAGQVKVYADFYDTYGFDIFGEPPVFSSDSAAWQTLSWEGTVPGLAVVGYILVKFYSQPDLYHFNLPAHVWMDNVQFRQDGGENKVANGGFEEWAVGINEATDNERLLSVYPNPAKDYIYIDWPGDVQEIFFSDITGREIYKEINSGRNQIRIDVNSWNEGVYIINSVLDSRVVVTQKLIIL
jgi:hypothetical protein